MHYSERSDHMVLIGSVLAPHDKNVRITNSISSVSVLHFCSYPPSHLVPSWVVESGFPLSMHNWLICVEN